MTTVKIIVKEKQTGAPISGALVKVNDQDKGTTDAQGVLLISLDPGTYKFEATAFGQQDQQAGVTISGPAQEILLEPDLKLKLSTHSEAFKEPIEYANQGGVVGLRVEHAQPSSTGSVPTYTYAWKVSAGTLVDTSQTPNSGDVLWHTFGAAGKQMVRVTITEVDTGVSVSVEKPFNVLKTADFQSVDSVPVSLRRTQIEQTRDQALWVAIRNRTKAISFSGSGYADFINKVLCVGDTSDIKGPDAPNATALKRQRGELYQPIHGVGAYELLRTATQVFLLLECGAVIKEADRYTGEVLYDPDGERSRLGRTLSFDDVTRLLGDYLGNNRLPYIERVLQTAFRGRNEVNSIFCEGYLGAHADCPPMLELIWSYWHEEAMLVQTMNALSLRFQNRRNKTDRDPLANLEIAPLYPLNNLLWGYIQDEVHRLSVARRNYEYSHHYGLKLHGKAISDFQPADPRSRFLEGFHNLLYQTTLFYKQDDDTTFNADGFPILNALREVHLVLSEGAHNQFGDLPWTARAEMLMEQWILSRPEMRLFLQSRDMVPYREAWMPQVDAMKQMQGWTDVTVTHFNFLAVHGEQLLLSIRYGDWVDITDPTQAANWARYWRPEIQNYIHAYRAATGVDLAIEARDSQQAKLRVAQPSELLRQRLSDGRTALASPDGAAAPVAQKGFRERRAERRATRVTTNGRK